MDQSLIDTLTDLLVPPTESVRRAIEGGVISLDRQHVDPETATALMQALAAQSMDQPSGAQQDRAGFLFARLLDLGGDPWSVAIDSMESAASLAMKMGWAKLVVQALGRPHPAIESLQVVDGRSYPPRSVYWLELAVENGDATMVRALLDAGANPTQVSPDEDPLLHRAIDVDTVQALLGAGADPCVTDADGRLCFQAWESEDVDDHVGMLSCLLDRGPGLDRFALLRAARKSVTGCRRLLEDTRTARDLIDEQGRSVFFHMAAATLNSRANNTKAYRPKLTTKRVFASIKAALSWYRQSDPTDHLDAGAAMLLLWSARKLSVQMLNAQDKKALQDMEKSIALPSIDAPNRLKFALSSLDEMVDMKLLCDPSEVAATALGGFWESEAINMAEMFSPAHAYPILPWMDRCYRGIVGGPWSQKKPENHRWASPDVPIQQLCTAVVDHLKGLDLDHPVWSNPDLGRMLVQGLRSCWPTTEAAYYGVTLPPLEKDWVTRLRARYEPIMLKMDSSAMLQALRDPLTNRTLQAMQSGDSPAGALHAMLSQAMMEQDTDQAPSRSRGGPRL